MLKSRPRPWHAASPFIAFLCVIATGIPACAQGPETVVPQPREGAGWRCTRASSCRRRREMSTCSSWETRSPRCGTKTASGSDTTRRGGRPISASAAIGPSTSSGGSRMASSQGIEPKVVVLMVGTNNLTTDTPDEIAQGIKAIVEELRHRLPKAKILLLGVFPRRPKARRAAHPAQSRQRKDRQARRRIARPISRHRQIVPERGRHDLTVKSCPTTFI